MKMTKYDEGWISALIDSEGCICHFRSNGSWQWSLEIVNTNLTLLRRAQSIIGGTIRTKQSSGKPAWTLFCGAKRMRLFLPQLSLIVKAKKRIAFMKDKR